LDVPFHLALFLFYARNALKRKMQFAKKRYFKISILRAGQLLKAIFGTGVKMP
jgi:hypothetical protein